MDDDGKRGYFATGRVAPVTPAPGTRLVTIVEGIVEDVARAGAVALLEAGIGAETDTGPEGWSLRVLAVDAPRAVEILGLPVPEADSEGAALLRPPESKKERPPWVRIAVIFVVAIIVIPLGAYYFTFKVTGGDCPSGPDVPASVILNTRC